jgi:cytoskeletal protein CcmA (bactofilin family)
MKISVKRLIRDEKGRALILALILLGVGGLTTTPLLAYMNTGLVTGKVYENKTAELYAADAGVEDAVWKIQQGDVPVCPGNPTWSYNISDVNDKSVDVTITYVNNVTGDLTYKVTSIATTDSDSSTTIESYVEVVYGGSSGGSSVFDYALTSLGGDIDLGGNSDVESDVELEGDIHANGNIYLSGNAEIDGDATATGVITTSGNADVNGEEIEGAESLVGPNIDTLVAECKEEAQDGGCAICGAITRSGSWTPSPGVYSNAEHVQGNMNINTMGTYTFGGTVCVDQNLSISSITTVTFNGPVYVQGDLSISSLASVTFQGPVMVNGKLTLSTSKDVVFGDTIYVGGNLIISSNIDVELGGTVYVCGQITMSGNAQLVGGETIIAEGDIAISGNSDLNEDAADLPLVISTGGDVTLTGNSDVAAVIYAPSGNILLEGNTGLYGCAVGLSVTGGGNNDVVYPIDLRERDDLPGAETGEGGVETINIVSWQIA